MFTSLESVVGNKSNIHIIRRYLTNKRFHKFTIFHGVFGTGKSAMARLVALSLNCKDSVEGNPCLTCENCKRNIATIKDGSTGNFRIKLWNMGQVKNIKEVEDILTLMIELKSGTEPTVIILDEFHAISSDLQVAFNNKLDLLNDNTHLILTTTELRRILPAIATRAIKYEMRPLAGPECKKIISDILEGGSIDKDLERILIQHSGGVPRELINYTKFVMEGPVTKSELLEHFGVIDSSVFVGLIASTKENSLENLKLHIEVLLQAGDPVLVFAQIKEFIENCVYMLNGTDSYFTSNEKTRLNKLITLQDIPKLLNLVNTTNLETFQQPDISLFCLRLKYLLNKETTLNKSLGTQVTTSRENSRVNLEQPKLNNPKSLTRATGNSAKTLMNTFLKTGDTENEDKN